MFWKFIWLRMMCVWSLWNYNLIKIFNDFTYLFWKQKILMRGIIVPFVRPLHHLPAWTVNGHHHFGASSARCLANRLGEKILAWTIFPRLIIKQVMKKCNIVTSFFKCTPHISSQSRIFKFFVFFFVLL